MLFFLFIGLPDDFIKPGLIHAFSARKGASLGGCHARGVNGRFGLSRIRDPG